MRILVRSAGLMLWVWAAAAAAPAAFADTAKVTIVQLNDVYEFLPVNAGTEGGLARVAQLVDDLKQENPNTFTVLSGDFLSPSAFGGAIKDNAGKKLAGRLMIKALKMIPIDYVTFGNHEFDSDVGDQLQDRINESAGFAAADPTAGLPALPENKPVWLTTNVKTAAGSAFANVVDAATRTYGPLKIALIGTTLNITPGKAKFDPPAKSAIDKAKTLKATGGAHVVVALSHLQLHKDPSRPPTDPVNTTPDTCTPTAPSCIDSDLILADLSTKDNPPGGQWIDLILGGHEHEAYPKAEPYTGTIFKADSNAKSVFIHRLDYDSERIPKLTITTELKKIPAWLPEKAVTARALSNLVKLACDQAAAQTSPADRFSPDEVVGSTSIALDGDETLFRKQPTNLGTLLGNLLRDYYAKNAADRPRPTIGSTPVETVAAALYNSGGVRIDDLIGAGPITRWHFKRMFAFPLTGLVVRLTGAELKAMLELSWAKRGTGGYLQTSDNIVREADGRWWITAPAGGAAVELSAANTTSYDVALAAFLASGADGYPAVPVARRAPATSAFTITADLEAYFRSQGVPADAGAAKLCPPSVLPL